MDILADGKLDFPDEVLAELDVVVASLHQGFSQNEAETTKRLVRAAENPYVHMLGHLTGRLLLEREPYKVDLRAVIDKQGGISLLEIVKTPSQDLAISAIEAVKTWRYKPYILNGEPVEVETVIVVRYTLSFR